VNEIPPSLELQIAALYDEAKPVREEYERRQAERYEQHAQALERLYATPLTRIDFETQANELEQQLHDDLEALRLDWQAFGDELGEQILELRREAAGPLNG
jgi:hypothetical protein